MPTEAGITGPAARLLIRIERYEYPTILDGPDANWLVGDVRLTAGTTSLFRATVPMTIMADELARLRDGLEAMLAGEAEQAILHHMEFNLGATIRAWDDLLTFSCYVRDDFAPEIRLREVQITRDQMQQAYEEFDALLKVFPVRALV